MHCPALTLVAVLAFASVGGAQAARPANANQTTRAATEQSSILPGTYDLELTFGGGTLGGTLVITAAGDSVDAKLLVGEHAPPIKTVTRKGSQLTLAGTGDGVDVRYDLQFSGDALVGKFNFNGDDGAVTGKRRK